MRSAETTWFSFPIVLFCPKYRADDREEVGERGSTETPRMNLVYVTQAVESFP